MSSNGKRPTASHWGALHAAVQDGRLVAVEPFRQDSDPSPVVSSLEDCVYHTTRITQPMVRASYLELGARGHCERSGTDAFVPMSWEQVLRLVASELRRVVDRNGHEAIYGGSYGWGSAGRLHNGPTLLHRFLSLFGGYTASVDSYSCAAANVVTPHVIGNFLKIVHETTDWRSIVDHTKFFVCFGGIALKNSQVVAGGCGRHTTRHWLERCREAGVKFANIGPVRDDVADFLGAEWICSRPGTDVAIMLGIAHTLVEEGLHDRPFLDRYCVGFERFESYLLGQTDGLPKTAEWASTLAAIEADAIRDLARRMASERTMLSVSWSLQRADHGEQVYWMAITLAAMLGQIGLPGGGFGLGYAATGNVGQPADAESRSRISSPPNPICRFIPVARVSDMLLNPGKIIDYNGQKIEYPDIRLVYWCGGNPFHHHQDLNRLCKAWSVPETIIVHEPWWSPVACRADIVLPANTTFERNDIGGSTRDPYILAMHKVIESVGSARSDFEILSDLSDLLGFGKKFTGDRSEMQWLRHFYDLDRQLAVTMAKELPLFEEFWETGYVEMPVPEKHQVLFESFRADPDANPLTTPSGRIEIFSQTVSGFGYRDCPGHAAWLEPEEWLGSPKAERFPLHLVSNQPVTRLHSQMDMGRVSLGSKIAGREPVSIHPKDAKKRGINSGDIVRVFNSRGACLAGAVVTDRIMPGVVQLATGAWFDPMPTGDGGSLCKHGNANVLTPDRGTSHLAQGPSPFSCLVEVELSDQDPPPITAFEPPPTI